MATEQARIRVARPGVPARRALDRRRCSSWPLVGLWLLINFIKAPADFYNLFLIGLTNGAVYGLVALGYSLVYGILELINFAHGDVFMLGGMLVATMTHGLGARRTSRASVLWLFILLMLLIAMAFCATINATIEIVAYRRLRNAPAAGAADHRDRHVVHPPEHRAGLEGSPTDLGAGHPPARRACSRSPAFPTPGTSFIVLLITIPVLLGARCGSSSGRGTARRCARPRRTARPPR